VLVFEIHHLLRRTAPEILGAGTCRVLLEAASYVSGDTGIEAAI